MSKATIFNVADEAGVSIKTVSRVINSEANIRPATREKVLKAIEKLSYRPSQMARGLAGKRSFMLGLIYSNLSPSYLVDVQKGILKACKEGSYGLSLGPIDHKLDNYLEMLDEWLKRSGVDGVVITPPFGAKAEVFECLAARNVKAIVISETAENGTCSLAIDEVQAARDLTRHLIEKGHKDIGFINGPNEHQSACLRYQGFKDQLTEGGLSLRANLIAEGDFTYEAGLSAARQLLNGAHRPTAIFAANDDMAAAVVTVANQMAIKIPDDLAVVGFDDAPLAQQVWPQLTTVNQPVFEMASLAAKRLIESVSKHSEETDEHDESVGLMPYELIIRGSS